MSDKFGYQEFVEEFPEFADVVEWPVPRVEFRIALANRFVRVCGLDDAVARHLKGLYTAHYLAAQGPSTESGILEKGALGGGVVSGKGVDGASISYDTSTGTEEGAGFWNLTLYGREYWQLMQMLGAGGVQL